MGLFDWFTNPRGNVKSLPDVIWVTRQAKFDGILRAVFGKLAERNRPAAIILVAQFGDCLNDLRALVDKLPASNAVSFIAAEKLSKIGTPQVSDESQSVLIIVAERHPLRLHDDAILEFARGLACRAIVVFHVSLDDAVMRKLAGPWVKAVLAKLGHGEDRPIESPVVAGQLRKAQQKMASACTSDHPADSADAWIERNCGSV